MKKAVKWLIWITLAWGLCIAGASSEAADAASGVRLAPQKIYEGVTASIPETFAPMSEALFALKYGDKSRRTTSAFTDSNGEANIVFELKHRQEDLSLLKDRVRHSLEKDPAIRRVSAAQPVISGRPALVFEFESQALDTPVFNIMFFINSGPGRSLMGSFNCPAAMAPQWRQAGREMVNSISID